MTASQATASASGGRNRQRTTLAAAAVLLAASLTSCGFIGGPADAGSLTGANSSAAAATAGTAQPGQDHAGSGASGSATGDAAGEGAPAKGTAGREGTAQKKEAAAKDVPKTAKEAVRAENARISGKEKAFAEDIDEGGGVAAAAVVELGHEACDRLAYLKMADAALIPGALASGQIANADAAIANLCPEFAAAQKTAQAGFGDGQFSVKGVSGDAPVVNAGTYVAATPTKHCSWQVLDRKGRVLATGGTDMVQNAAGNDPSFSMTVAHSAASVVSNGCYAWLPKG